MIQSARFVLALYYSLCTQMQLSQPGPPSAVWMPNTMQMLRNYLYNYNKLVMTAVHRCMQLYITLQFMSEHCVYLFAKHLNMLTEQQYAL